jgi:hypothetical protein
VWKIWSDATWTARRAHQFDPYKHVNNTRKKKKQNSTEGKGVYLLSEKLLDGRVVVVVVVRRVVFVVGRVVVVGKGRGDGDGDGCGAARIPRCGEILFFLAVRVFCVVWRSVWLLHTPAMACRGIRKYTPL